MRGDLNAAAIIVAAGRGARAGGDVPKQYQTIAGRMMLEWTLDVFNRHPQVNSIVVVIDPAYQKLFEHAARQMGEKLHGFVPGGAERQDSVRLALESLSKAAPSAVLIHDAARPFTPPELIDRALAALHEADGACPSLPVADTVRYSDDGLCGDLVDRANLWRAQTPQAFHFEPILKAHQAATQASYTDDAELARAHGLKVAITLGAEHAQKVTRPEDFQWAEEFAQKQQDHQMETRFGQGFDVHKFGPNADGSTDHVMLCGIPVPHESGLMGHSDADVGLHALTDAILGAMALGDIGRHFPPSDPQWHAANSSQFLAHAAKLVREKGGRIVNVDVTLICERPKITPHAPQMRAKIAEILEVNIERVSVKATTTEKLGFTGRQEGIAAQACASVECST